MSLTFRRLQASEQYRTSSQLRDHFFRKVITRPQLTQIFWSRVDIDESKHHRTAADGHIL